MQAPRDGVLPAIRLWAVVVVFAAITAARSVQVDIPLRDPHGSVFWSRLGIAVALTVLIAIGHAAWTARGRMFAELRARWTRGRIALAAIALLGYQVVYLCYRNLKSWDVLNEPRDDLLLRWDRFLFLGHDPATLLHDLLGQHYAAYVLTGIYSCFSAVVTLTVASSVALPSRIRDTYAVLSSLALTWILGVASYYLIPSLGPFASKPELFRDLPQLVVQDNQDRYLEQRAQLLAHPEWGDSFAQISAFASLHTGVLCTIMLLALHLGLRRVAAALGVLLAGTMVATIYLGWHFVLDDVAGVLIAVLAVAGGTRLAGSTPRSRSATRPADAYSIGRSSSA